MCLIKILKTVKTRKYKTMFSNLAVRTLIKTSKLCRSEKCSLNVTKKKRSMATPQQKSILAAAGSNAGSSTFRENFLLLTLSFLKFSDAVKTYFGKSEKRKADHDSLLDFLIKEYLNKILNDSSSSADSSEQKRAREIVAKLRNIRYEITLGTDNVLSEEERQLLLECTLDFLLDNGQDLLDIFQILDPENFTNKKLRAEQNYLNYNYED